MENAKQPRKGFYLLPNMLTTFSMFLGFLSMVWAGQGRFEDACMAILVAALMDGWTARWPGLRILQANSACS